MGWKQNIKDYKRSLSNRIKRKGETDMFMKIKEYYSHCYLCKGKYLIEVFGDTTAKVKRIHKCKCES